MDNERKRLPSPCSGDSDVNETATVPLPSPATEMDRSQPNNELSEQNDPGPSVPTGSHGTHLRRRSLESYRIEPTTGRQGVVARNVRRMTMEDRERPEKRIKLNPQQPENRDPVPEYSSNRPTEFPRDISSEHNHPEISAQTEASMKYQYGTCSESLDELVSALIELRCEVISPFPVGEVFRDRSEVTKHGHQYSLTWATTETRRLLGIMRDSHSNSATAPAKTLSHLGSVNTGQARLDRPPLATLLYGARPFSHAVENNDMDAHSRRASGSLDQLPHVQPILPPILPLDDMKRQRYYDHAPTGSTASPHASSSSSVYGGNQSPTQNQNFGRALPSPPGVYMPSSSLPMPGHLGNHPQASAHTTHLQDLQHQISTKTLALQTLQREHDQLLAAFSRSQIRCSTLDKKSQVSDHEINNLSEEKIRLQQQVETLESQIEDLAQTRESVQKQSSAEAEQWRQIMARSSQLQIRSAEEARSHKQEQEQWQEERQRLLKRLRALEESRRGSGEGSGEATRALDRFPVSSHQEDTDMGGSMDDVLHSTSVQILREEIRYLRRKCDHLEAVLNDVTGEAEQLNRAMANIRARISGEMSTRVLNNKQREDE